MLDCPHWLFSTNGDKFQHPDPLIIARILTSRRGEDSLLFFNYRSKESAVWDAPKLQKEFHYEPFFPKSKSGGIAIEL
jgi:hypothetical protein